MSFLAAYSAFSKLSAFIFGLPIITELYALVLSDANLIVNNEDFLPRINFFLKKNYKIIN